MKINKHQNKLMSKREYLFGVGTGLLLALLLFKITPVFVVKARNISSNLSFLGKTKQIPTPDPSVKLKAVAKEVFPSEVNLGITLGDTIVKMVKFGAIDKDKFIELYKNRGGLSLDEQAFLETPSDKELVITELNANLILNLLWPLGIVNKTNVLSDGPMGTQYKNEVGNFASTGGWTLGKESGGNLFNKYEILPLNTEQEALVTEIAKNIYRPCCGNSTYFPDCNHGAAMLGFIELAVVQGIPKDEIYKKALAINSYWFPQTYADLAVYFQAKKNIPWKSVDPVTILGEKYSSGQGSRAIDNELQAEGLLPKVEGGGGCGV